MIAFPGKRQCFLAPASQAEGVTDFLEDWVVAGQLDY